MLSTAKSNVGFRAAEQMVRTSATVRRGFDGDSSQMRSASTPARPILPCRPPPTSGGSTCLSASRDPRAPPCPGSSRRGSPPSSRRAVGRRRQRRRQHRFVEHDDATAPDRIRGANGQRARGASEQGHDRNDDRVRDDARRWLRDAVRYLMPSGQTTSRAPATFRANQAKWFSSTARRSFLVRGGLVRARTERREAYPPESVTATQTAPEVIALLRRRARGGRRLGAQAE